MGVTSAEPPSYNDQAVDGETMSTVVDGGFDPALRGSETRKMIRVMQAERDALQSEVLLLKREIRALREGLMLARRRERIEMNQAVERLRGLKAVMEAKADALSCEITAMLRGSC